jgi:hypothetical protein
MWIVEVNFAGRRFTLRVHGHRRPITRFSQRYLNWIPSQLRQQRAA